MQLRQAVFERANYRCEYCFAPAVIGIAMQLDHIQPVSQGGLDEMDNLCLACNLCNGHKWANTTHFDGETGLEVPLFNARQQNWGDHFQWNEDFTQILGLTAIGRATIDRLQMNSPQQQMSRSLWIKAGVHPPID